MTFTIASVPYPSPSIKFDSQFDVNRSIKSNSDIDKRVNDKIKDFTSKYQKNTLSDVIINGSGLIMLAYTGSKTFPCSAKVYSNLSDYQLFIKESSITSDSLLSTSLSSLQKYRAALQLADQLTSVKSKKDAQKMQQIFETINETASLAKTMADEAKGLFSQSDRFLEKVEEGIKEAQGDNFVRKDRNTKMLDITVESLITIKNTFQDIKLFWSGIEKECITLSNISAIKNAGGNDKKTLINQIKMSGLNWLAIAQICQTASIDVKKSNATVNTALTNMPT